MKNRDKLLIVKAAGLPTEVIGGGLSDFAMRALGSTAGFNLAQGSDKRLGLDIGAAVGGGIPHLAAMISALVTKTRSRDEQVEAEGDGLMNFIPGMAQHNMYKRLGHSAWGKESPGEEANVFEPFSPASDKDGDEKKDKDDI